MAFKLGFLKRNSDAVFEQRRSVTGMLVAFAVICFIVAVVLLFVDTGNQRTLVKHRSIVKDGEIAIRNIINSSQRAISGDVDAFSFLANGKTAFQTALTTLLSGDGAQGTPAMASSPNLESVAQLWGVLSVDIDVMLNGKEQILEAVRNANTVTKALPALLSDSDALAGRLTKIGAHENVVYVSTRQTLLVERMLAAISTMQKGDDLNGRMSDRLATDASFFSRVINALLQGDARMQIPRVSDTSALQVLKSLRSRFDSLQTELNYLANKDVMGSYTKANSGIDNNAGTLATSFAQLDNDLSQQHSSDGFITLIAAVFGLAGLGLLISAGIIGQRVAASRAQQANDQNRKNQQAILRLLDEMTHLAEGDLTSYATVTEDITGAIADSMNYSIDALRTLVETINSTVVNVSTSSEQTQAVTKRLQDASLKQSEEIATATNKINVMSKTMESMADKANTSADVALKSVDIANRGAETVRKNIDGMDVVRVNIQETSKRIKRLGESSQQIGEIVALITDIADQTNILALNAAIQASSAGEAGRGFAVVADEVQRLAERAGNATKQISALVKTIQADTNEAVASMEQSTAGVVNGAQLAEDAGLSLVEVETVSKQLADLIQGISGDASNQAGAAKNIASSMGVLQSITVETSDSTNQTARAVDQLTKLANELRQSIAGFKLPGADAGADNDVLFN